MIEIEISKTKRQNVHFPSMREKRKGEKKTVICNKLPIICHHALYQEEEDMSTHP
jgi:hypothetical protein